MQKFMVSRNNQLADEGSSEPVEKSPSGGSDLMAHQFDCIHGNEPMLQIMIQLIGCRLETNAAKTVRGRSGHVA